MILVDQKVKLLDLTEDAKTAHHSSTQAMMPDLALLKFALETRS
jgi:hypothetical protein